MSGAVEFQPGGYRYVPGVFQYSAGVAALPGFEIVHARLARSVALAEGFERVRQHLSALGRPLTAFCACELRSPAPFTEDGFRAFNEVYVGTLAQWGIYRDGANPVARSNVCPKIDPPAEPSLYAFAYTVPALEAPPSCAVAGSGEAPEGKANYRDHIVALDDVSAAGLRAKALFVTSEMRRRLAALDFAEADPTTAQVYTVQPLHDLIETVLLPSGLCGHGFALHHCRPPVEGLEFEMDCRIVRREIVI
ncbi:MAG: hypothetical protein ACFCUN_05640 [Hyphomicrobiaceae bacterium]